MTVTNALCNTFLKDKRHEVPFVPRGRLSAKPSLSTVVVGDIGNGLGVVTLPGHVGMARPVALLVDHERTPIKRLGLGCSRAPPGC
jgi:hypothetical protein